MNTSIFTCNRLFVTLLLSFFSFTNGNAQYKTITLDPFQKVVISPYIEVVFEQAAEEAVLINNSKVPKEKINIESSGDQLHIYLEDAKVVGKQEGVIINGNKRKEDVYKGTQVSITIQYKYLKSVEIRGEEHIDFKDPLNAKDFDLDLYGSPKVIFKSLTAEKLKVALYGESYLEVNDGAVEFQRYRSYGDSKVNTLALVSKETKIAAYGSNQLMVHASEELKVSAFGDVSIQYKGNPEIKNGLKIGDIVLQKMD
ncbi:head GIN domain-containing protein [Flavimarina sp. Hel_I_48]|uniref:head GIN domain-containing protein n=1 Tax=Flavimarina sp. Hel_I_48 TaxID=1392488 RepID=UPI0004DEDE8E|nr:head GIN domain-containing protein [Flavimarina sp. Hel_I_48]